MFDVIVVGGGVAGLSGAMYLARLRRRVLVVDGGRPANRFSHAAHSFFTRDGVPPAELLAIAREQLARYGTVEIRPGEVTALVAHPDRFEALLSDGDAVSGRKVLLATGLEDRLPAIEGIERFWGISAFHCPYCDGWELHDQPIAICASGEAGLNAAKMLHTLTDDLTLCSNGPAGLADDDRAALLANGIRIIETPIARFEGREAQIEAIVFTDGSRVACRGVFARTEAVQPSTLAAQLGCAMTDDGLVEVDQLGRTSVAGVYAAGDMAHPIRQITMAASQGAAAGIGINADLIGEDFYRARPG